jgi:hypothetical protein
MALLILSVSQNSLCFRQVSISIPLFAHFLFAVLHLLWITRPRPCPGQELFEDLFGHSPQLRVLAKKAERPCRPKQQTEFARDWIINHAGSMIWISRPENQRGNSTSSHFEGHEIAANPYSQKGQRATNWKPRILSRITSLCCQKMVTFTETNEILRFRCTLHDSISQSLDQNYIGIGIK